MVNTTIWKYELEVTYHQTLEIPKDAKLLCVQNQYGHPYLWALVDPAEDKVERQIRCCGTGHTELNIGHNMYLGTTQMAEGNLIWHWFAQ